MLLIRYQFIKTWFINCTLTEFSQFLCRLKRAFESFHKMDLQSVDIYSVSWKAVCFLVRFTTEIGRDLFHLHGISPICLSLEKLNLKVFLVFFCEFSSHRAFMESLFLVFFTRYLSEPKRASQPDHTTTAVAVIATVIAVTKTVLILCCFNNEKYTLGVGFNFFSLHILVTVGLDSLVSFDHLVKQNIYF